MFTLFLQKYISPQMANLNYSKDTVRVLTNAKSLVPFTTNGTGTIATTGKIVTGTGTLFLTEMPVGSILWNGAGEYRTVKQVSGNLKAVLDHPFTADIGAGATPHILKPQDNNAIEIDVIFSVLGGTITTTEDAAIPNNMPVGLSKSNRQISSSIDFVSPLIVDATGGATAIINLMRY
jgi:hypothetical protein